MKWWVLLMTVGLSTTEAWAAGPVINHDCDIAWTAPTIGTDGQPLSSKSAITGYKLYRGTVPGVYTGSVTIPAITATKCSLVGITANGQWSIALSSLNAAGEGPKTADVPFVLDAPVTAVGPGNVQVQ